MQFRAACNGHLFASPGFPDSPVLVEEQPGEVEVRADVCDRLVKAVRQVSSEMETAEVRLTQSCHLPVTRDGPCACPRALRRALVPDRQRALDGRDGAERREARAKGRFLWSGPG